MTETKVFDPDLWPDLGAVRDRASLNPNVERVWFPEGAFAQAADFNESFTREADKRKAIGDLIARDCDRLSGAEILVDVDAGTVTITGGILYLIGAPRVIDERLMTGVPMTGDVELGVRVISAPVTSDDDPVYLGLVEGTVGFGESGAVRSVLSFEWAFDSDGGEGNFFRYVLMRDGVVVAQDAPPTLTGVQNQIAAYDVAAHGNYIVKGCKVETLGTNGTKRIFAIGAGESNILGRKVIRNSDSRIEIEEMPSVGNVPAEPHTFDTADTVVLTVRHPPIAAINIVVITKQRTVTVIKGVTGSADLLPDTGVTEIISVVQGGTTYVAVTDYLKAGDGVSWAPAGAEPATGSSVDVTYNYLAPVAPDAIDARTVTLSGGVTGKDIFLNYDYKLPRHDKLCMTEEGLFEYLRGQSSPTHPLPPAEPSSLLSLCQVQNDWFGEPLIKNDGTPAITFKEQNEINERLKDALNLIGIERLQNAAIARAPGPTLGLFVDPFTDDGFRDLGEAQDAASFEGSLQIGIDTAFHEIHLPEVVMLNYSLETIINQPLATRCEKINPYQNFTPVPPKIGIDPHRDFWTEVEEVTKSERTRVIGRGNNQRIKKKNTIKRYKEEPIRNLRQITINFRIEDFGAGETLANLTFDDIDVTPPGMVADADGVITGSFVIPAKVNSGVKQVRATGGSGRSCATRFRGQGTIERTITRETTIIERFRDDPPVFPSRPGGGEPAQDPQAQSFVLERGRHIASIDLKFCQIGDKANPVAIDLVAVGDQGQPTQQILGTVSVDMNTVLANQWSSIAFGVPVYVPAGTYVAFVVKTDDAVHSISAANLGDFDAATQTFVTTQPYVLGDRFSGSNSVSWQVHPDSDLTYRSNACRFTQTTKTVDLGTFAVTDVSDLMIQASIILPEASSSVVFKVDVDGTLYSLLPDQNLELTAFYTGNINIKAVLTGTEFASPILAQDILVILGTMRPSGAYVGRAWVMGSSVQVNAAMSTWLPNGSAMTVEVDAGDDNWSPMGLVESTPIDDGFVERSYSIDPHDAPLGGRVRIVLTGTPAARPALADLRMFVY